MSIKQFLFILISYSGSHCKCIPKVTEQGSSRCFWMGGLLGPSHAGSRYHTRRGGSMRSGVGHRGCCYDGGRTRQWSEGIHDECSLSKREIMMYAVDMTNICRRPRSPARGMHYTIHYSKYEQLTCNQKKKPRKMFSCFMLSLSTSLSFSWRSAGLKVDNQYIMHLQWNLNNNWLNHRDQMLFIVYNCREYREKVPKKI